MAEAEIDYEARAREIGWVPKDEYHGGSGEWLPAEDFYQKSITVLPILRKTNEGLHTRLAALNTEVTRVKADLRAANASVQTILESQEEDLKARETAIRKSLLQEKKQALKDDDTDRAVDIDEELRELDEAGKTPTKKAVAKVETPAGGTPELDPEVLAAYNAWTARNPQMKSDPTFVEDAETAAIAVRRAFERSGTAYTPEAFWAEVDKRIVKLRPAARPRGESKVEGGELSGDSSSSTASGQTFSDLPAEAKAQARKDAKKFVGKDRAYKTDAEWHAAYARRYFES